MTRANGQRSPCVTLLTDFGTADGYVGALKGVLASLCPGVIIHDITHDVPPGDVLHGAFALATAAPLFPPGTIHLAVVDPGVGTSRRAVAVVTEAGTFVGPDNGLLSLAARPPRRVFVLDRSDVFLESVSSTFHGRDVFAPVAARLAAGWPPDRIGTPAADLMELELPKVARCGGGVEGAVIHCDRFGNLITNLREADLPEAAGEVSVEIAGHRIAGISRTYGDRAPGELLALFGSLGFLEIAVSKGAAAARLGVSRGAAVRVFAGATSRNQA
ncbi:MAG: hypothetical protein D6815_05445 [Candidatus Dadabacteria bacterium]|nr:MAG: hypothetical protein D6815_05445 [Candidatus Dadabacteria bacterium]